MSKRQSHLSNEAFASPTQTRAPKRNRFTSHVVKTELLAEEDENQFRSNTFSDLSGPMESRLDANTSQESITSEPTGCHLAKVEAGPSSYIVVECTEGRSSSLEQVEKISSGESHSRMNKKSIIELERSEKSDVESEYEVDLDLSFETIDRNSSGQIESRLDANTGPESFTSEPSGFHLAKVESGPSSYIVVECTESTSSSLEQAEKISSGETHTQMNKKSIIELERSEKSDVESEYEVDLDLSSVIRIATADIDVEDDDADFELVQARIPTVAEREIPPSELLDAEDEDFIATLQERIDNEQNNLLGTDVKFDWTEDFSTFRGVAEEFSGGKTGPTRPMLTPYDAFSAIWDEDIISVIVKETNRYAQNIITEKIKKGSYAAQARMRKWVDVTAEEILILFSVFILMGLYPVGRLDTYWKRKGLVKITGFREIMTFHRYVVLTKCLHFVDNRQQSDTDRKLFKLRPIVDHLNRKFPELYVMKRAISLDESLSLWKGLLSWVQTIRTKSARFGIKTFEVCEASTGYLWKFEVYTGKVEGGSEVSLNDALSGKNCKIVLELLKGLEHKGYCVVMDNFYNCPALARYLKSQGFDCLGTVRANRKHMPEAVKALKESVPKGTIVSRHSGDVSVVSWKDSKLVNMISTFHDSSTYVGRRAGKAQVKPVCVRDYNKGMGGVDLKDQKLSMYLIERKRGAKWYIKMFKRLINVSVHNSYILHNASLVENGQRPLTHRHFREILFEDLIVRFRNNKPIPRPISCETRLRMDIHHFPIKVLKRVRCVVCSAAGKRKVVGVKCESCMVGLCLGPCFREYHTAKRLK